MLWLLSSFSVHQGRKEAVPLHRLNYRHLWVIHYKPTDTSARSLAYSPSRFRCLFFFSFFFLFVCLSKNLCMYLICFVEVRQLNGTNLLTCEGEVSRYKMQFGPLGLIGCLYISGRVVQLSGCLVKKKTIKTWDLSSRAKRKQLFQTLLLTCMICLPHAKCTDRIECVCASQDVYFMTLTLLISPKIFYISWHFSTSMNVTNESNILHNRPHIRQKTWRLLDKKEVQQSKSPGELQHCPWCSVKHTSWFPNKTAQSVPETTVFINWFIEGLSY